MSKPPLIACRELTKIYKMGDNEVRALDGVTLDIDYGEFVAIMGASGSGKSTLMNMLGGLDQPTSGEVIVDGQDISNFSSRKLADFRNTTVGFVFQQFQLLPKKSAQSNVRLPLDYRRPSYDNADARAAECLEKVGLGERLDHRPTELSGGQQQRVAIARALAGSPKIIMADEPTGALDSKTSNDIMDLMVELNQQGITILIITHDIEVADYADRVIEFRDGRILSDDEKRVA